MRTTTRSAHRWLGVLALIMLFATSCYTDDAATHQANDPHSRPWWCMSTGDGGHHVDPAYHGMTKGMLSWEDCTLNSVGFDLAIAYAQQWPTLGDAEADGWHRAVTYVEGMGTHHVRLEGFDPTGPGFDPDNPSFPGTAIDDYFTAAQPEFLMYDGNGADAELTGFAWFFESDSTTPPEGFGGDNDWWHRHESLCFTNSSWQVVGENVSDTVCSNRGGTNLDLSNFWMLHAWIIDPWTVQFDVFANHHPCLHQSGPAVPGDGDPCWEEAHSGGGHSEH